MANTLNDSYKYKPNIFSRISNQIQSIFDFNYNFRIKAPKINFKILSSFFSTKGYLNRAQYAIVFLSISVLFNLGLYLLAKINFFESDFNLYSYILFFIIITAIQTSKRIHDFDGNNLIMLLFFVPFGFPLLLIYLFAKPGYYA